jgi:hypothetical protein
LPIAVVYALGFAATGLPFERLYGWLHPEGAASTFGLASFLDVGWSLLHGFSPSENLERAVSKALLLAPAAIAAAFAVGLRPASRRHPRELALCAAIAAIYLPFALWYGGPTFQYSPPLVVAVLLAAVLCANAVPRRNLLRPLVSAYALVFAATGVALTLIPAHRPSDSLERADFVARATQPGDRVLVVGAGNSLNDPVYFPYFARRDAISLWRLECCSDPARDLLEELDQELSRTLNGGARVFVLDSAIAPGQRLPDPWGGSLSIGGDALRAALERKYRLNERARFSGRGYSEQLLEIERRDCGPEPHYKSIAGACLPSCGVMLNGRGVAPSEGACCPRGCAASARLIGRAWDCQACCTGQPPLCD